MKLRKWVHIVLFLIMIIVLVFYTIDRFNIETPLTTISNEYCGDKICQPNENQNNCCIDCGCSYGQCINNECRVVVTATSTTLDTTQTTGNQSGESPPNGESSSPGETQTTETTTTTLYIGCSQNNCEACVNATVCYGAGCVWCKVSSRCLIICKG